MFQPYNPRNRNRPNFSPVPPHRAALPRSIAGIATSEDWTSGRATTGFPSRPGSMFRGFFRPRPDGRRRPVRNSEGRARRYPVIFQRVLSNRGFQCGEADVRVFASYEGTFFKKVEKRCSRRLLLLESGPVCSVRCLSFAIILKV